MVYETVLTVNFGVDLLIDEIGGGQYEYNLQYGGAIIAQHSHRLTIADDDVVRVLLAKLVKGGAKQGRRDKLLRALDDAARHYKDSNQKSAPGVLPWAADGLRSRTHTSLGG